MHADEADSSKTSLVLPLVCADDLLFLIDVDITNAARSWTSFGFDTTNDLAVLVDEFNTVDDMLTWDASVLLVDADSSDLVFFFDFDVCLFEFGNID